MGTMRFQDPYRAGLGAFCFILAGFLCGPSKQASAASFFEGKTITMVVGYGAGGGFDSLARLLARHMPRYVPGKPRFIVQNKPGAGSLIAANWVYAQQPGDGRTIGVFHYSFVTQAFMDDPTVKFDPLKYIWFDEPTIGTLPRIVFIRGNLPIRTLEDLKNYKGTLGMAETGRGTASAVATEFLKDIGLPVKNILGYSGSADSFASVERGETDGRVTSQESAITTYKRLLDDGIIRPILSMGKEPRLEPFSGVATLEDLNLNAEQKQLAQFLIRTWSRLRMFVLPPGTPPDRVKVLRDAFKNTLKDDKFLAEAKRQRMIISPAPWQEVVADIEGLAKAPRAIVEKYRELLLLR